MYLLVQAHQYEQYAGLLDQSFRIRQQIFADRLGWNVSVSESRERDHYDDLHPTLLYDIFRETFPDTCDLAALDIWEGTRMCVDEDAIVRDLQDMQPHRAFCLLLVAVCEVALDNGINTMISNYEPYLKRFYQKARAEFDEFGRSHRFGRVPVCCSAFEVSKRVLVTMRHKIKVVASLYRRPVFTQCITPEPRQLSV